MSHDNHRWRLCHVTQYLKNHSVEQNCLRSFAFYTPRALTHTHMPPRHLSCPTTTYDGSRNEWEKAEKRSRRVPTEDFFLRTRADWQMNLDTEWLKEREKGSFFLPLALAPRAQRKIEIQRITRDYTLNGLMILKERKHA